VFAPELLRSFNVKLGYLARSVAHQFDAVCSLGSGCARMRFQGTTNARCAMKAVPRVMRIPAAYTDMGTAHFLLASSLFAQGNE
jgi:hypothetical protein